jgi:LysM repeat protein
MKTRSILTVICLVIGFCYNQVQAQPQKRQQFEEYIVKKGDTPASIAASHHITKKYFLLQNDYPDNVKLEVGQKVIIRPLAEGEQSSEAEAPSTPKKATSSYKEDNSGASRKSSESSSSSRNSSAEKTAPPASNKPVEVGPGGTQYKVSDSGYHIVQRGQTFYRIALIYGLTVDQLKALNNLTNTNVEVGQKLRVK